jgi:hypothetical protein
VDITIGLGWIFEDRDGDSFSLPAGYTVAVPAGGYAVLGRYEDTGINGGAPVDYGYASGMDLGNSGDEIVLVHDGSEIDEVAYLDGSGWPDPSGSSISLDPDALDHSDNDDYNNWCSGASSSYGDGDNGTPGSVNDDC